MAGRKVVATNRKARHDYEIIDTFECGIVLRGSEVKSLRDAQVQLKDAYADIRDGEIWLERAHIARQFGYEESYRDAGTARKHFAESVELYQQIGHKLGMAYALLGLGRAMTHLGALGEAEEAMKRSISLHREAGNEIGQCETMATLGGLLAQEGRFQEAEDLVRQSLSLTPEANRFGIAFGLGFLGHVQFLSGRLAEAEAATLESISLFEDLGWRVWAVGRSINLARVYLHAGQVGAAHVKARHVVAQAREIGWGRGAGYGKLVLGEVALAEGDDAGAQAILQESKLDLKEHADEAWDVNQSPWLALAARGLAQRAEAWRHLTTALDWVATYHRALERLAAQACLALLLVDEGKVETAVEVYALASRHPLVANSRWFEMVAGRQIAAAAAALPDGVAEAARERGRELDLAVTLQELAGELDAFPPEPHRSGSGSDSGTH